MLMVDPRQGDGPQCAHPWIAAADSHDGEGGSMEAFELRRQHQGTR